MSLVNWHFSAMLHEVHDDTVAAVVRSDSADVDTIALDIALANHDHTAGSAIRFIHGVATAAVELPLLPRINRYVPLWI